MTDTPPRRNYSKKLERCREGYAALNATEREDQPVGDPMSADEARALTDRIKTYVETAWTLIEEAYLRRAWIALDYESWDVYCINEFGTARLRIPREERPEMVTSLRQAGLSIRAIASASGTGVATVHRDIEAGAATRAGVPNGTPDGWVDQEQIDADQIAEELIANQQKTYRLIANQPPITGTDGKTYRLQRKPEPKPEPSEDDWAAMTVKFRAAKRNLQDVIGYALNIHGWAEREGQRDNAVEYVEEVRDILDAIVSAARGESLDTEINRLIVDAPAEQIAVPPDRPSTKAKSGDRPGATSYSKGIQEISASIADNCESLTDEQVMEALGAAQYLYELLSGEKILRERVRGWG